MLKYREHRGLMLVNDGEYWLQLGSHHVGPSPLRLVFVDV